MRIGGLATGMDIESFVNDLMRAERIPLDKLTQEKQWLEWQKDAYREVNVLLADLRDRASKLRFQSSLNPYKVTSSQEGIVTASSTGSTTPGSYSVTVKSLASSAKLQSENPVGVGVKSTDLVGAGSFTIATSKGSATIEVTDTDTYSSLANKIRNAVDDTTGVSLGLYANFDDTTSRFFFSTKGMGSAESISISGGLADTIMGGTAGSYSANGTDGEIDFNGIAVTGLTSNTVTVNGIKLSLSKADPNTTVTITSKTDTEAPLSFIKDFVEKYNEIIDTIQKKVVEPRYKDYQPLTDEQKSEMTEKQIELWEEKARSGLLRNDSILQSAILNLRKAFMDPVEGIANGQTYLLSQIGINTGNYREGGKLFIDEDKLKAALENNPEEVMNLFTKNDGSGVGIGQRLYNELNNTIKSLGDKAGNPNVLVDNSTITKRLREMDEEVTRWQDRLSQIEDRYWRQFTAMEKAINQMNQQSSWLMTQFMGGSM